MRTAHQHRDVDVDAVADATGAKPRDWRAPDLDPGEGEAPA
ncbi:hypothetical protein [Actinoplanes campanulatus]|nr:hypothetical protein [Actinoplanes capillaceus]